MEFKETENYDFKISLRSKKNSHISVSSCLFYRHKIIGTNFRRSRFQPKIYNDHEKAYRLVVAQIIKRMGALNFLSTDESKTQTGQLGVYHNRLPATKPNCVGYEPASYKSINVWAGISSVGHTRPVVCFKFLMKCVLIIN